MMNLKPERQYFMQGNKKNVFPFPLTDPDF